MTLLDVGRSRLGTVRPRDGGYPGRPNRHGPVRSLLGRVDWVLVVSALVLVAIGIVSVYAATRDSLIASGGSGTAYLKRDLINAAIGTGLALPVAFVDYRTLRAYVPVAYGLVVLALLAVLSPLGTRVNGAHSWFSFGFFQLEPSEFAKLAVILLMAAVLTERRVDERPLGVREVATSLGVAALPMVLVFAEPALGMSLAIGIIAVGVIAASEVRGRWVAGLLGAAVVAGALVFSLHLLKPYQAQRFDYFTSAKGARTTVGYQIEQSKIAIGSGGLYGQGFLKGSQTNGGFIPEQQTDFAFTVAAEEGGFVGCAVLVVAIGTLLWRGLRIAERAADPFGRVVAAGIVVWFALQAFVNIGMTLGIMPVTGLPLPFVSYGGSAMFVDLVAVGLLLNIGARAPTTVVD